MSNFIKRTMSKKGNKGEKLESNHIKSLNPKHISQLNASEKINKSFQNQALIGRGSFGEVFRASWTETKQETREVALKKVKIKQETNMILNIYRTLRSNQLKNLPDMSKLTESFGKIYNFSKYDTRLEETLPEERTEPTEMRTKKEMDIEIKIWRKIQKEKHEGLLYLHQSLYVDNECWLVMELCAQGNLYFFVKNFVFDRTFPLTLDICLELVAPIVSACKYIHDLGVIHKDIKPENILLTEGYQPKLSDFTLCTEFIKTRALGEKSYIKHTDSYSGTPTYSPPEAFYGKKYNTTWDSWSIVCLILYLKFGKVCWTLTGGQMSDEDLADLFSVTSFDKIENGTKIEEVEHEYLSKMCVVPKNAYIKSNTEDDFPWCETRLKFAEFAKLCLCWKMETRLSCKQMCEHEIFSSRVDLWEKSPREAQKRLRIKIDEWINDDTFIDDKWLIF